LIVAAIPAFIRWRTRQQRLTVTASSLLAQGAWQELRDTMVDYGGTWDEAQTPRQAARRIATSSALPRQAVDAIGRILRATETALYANPSAQVSIDRQALEDDLRVIRQALAARDTRRQRWAARLLPTSGRLPWSRTPTDRDSEDLRHELRSEREFERV
jgi:hypothetical protein